MISIGAVLGEPGQMNSAAGRAMMAAMRAAGDLCGTDEIAIGPGVNVVFYVPGRISSPDWEGLRDGKFSRKRKLLMVQVAVPKERVASDSAIEFVIRSLHEASLIAWKVFQRKGIEFDLSGAEQLIESIKQCISSTDSGS